MPDTRFLLSPGNINVRYGIIRLASPYSNTTHEYLKRSNRAGVRACMELDEVAFQNQHCTDVTYHIILQNENDTWNSGCPWPAFHTSDTALTTETLVPSNDTTGPRKHFL